MKDNKTKILVEGAVMVALATVLSFIRVFKLPWGGSITLLSMLPIVLFSIRRGVKSGLTVSFVFALIQFAHNDEKKNDPDRYTSPEKGGEFRQNLTMFAKKLMEKGVKPLLLTPVTRRKFEGDVIVNSHGDYPEAIKETAGELNIPCMDLTKATMDYFEKAGEKGSRRFFMNFESGLYENFPEGKRDDSHLRPDGASVVSRLFVSCLLKEKDKWSDYKALTDGICVKGIYEDKEIDDEKLMW